MERKDNWGWERAWRTKVRWVDVVFEIRKDDFINGYDLRIKIDNDIYSEMEFKKDLEIVKEFCRWFADGMNWAFLFVKNKVQFLDW